MAYIKQKKMTLKEAIIHCREVASNQCGQCAADHEQLAQWLEELAKLRAAHEKGD